MKVYVIIGKFKQWENNSYYSMDGGRCETERLEVRGWGVEG